MVYGVFALAAVGLISWIHWQSNGQIPVSRETTYLTEPLLPDGRVNYALAIAQQRKKEISPENNAAIPFLQATWPCDVQPNQWGPLCRELKIQIPHQDGLRMPYHPACERPFRAWLAAQADLDEAGVYPGSIQIRHLLLAASGTPWDEAQFPPLAAWLEEQTPHLDRLHEIQGKSRCYFPAILPSHYVEAELTAMRFPMDQYLRSAAEALSIRAMHRLGLHQPEIAWRDVEAIYALSALRPAQPSLIELNSTYMVREQANAVTHALVTSGECDGALLAQIERRLIENEPLDQVKAAVSHYERIVVLDALIRGTTRQADASVNIPSLDPSKMTRRLNENFDRIATILEQPDSTLRRAGLKQLASELSADADHSLLGNLVGTVQLAAAGERAADDATSVFLPSVLQMCATEARVNVGQQLLSVAVRLEQHRQQTGGYPENLTAAFDPQLVRDPFADGPLQYRRFPDGYLLYTLFENRVDDTIEHLAEDAQSYALPKQATPHLDVFLAAPSPTFKSQLEAELQSMAP